MTDYSRRQKVLQQLNSQLQTTGRFNLGVTGSKLQLLQANKGVPEPKPSRIPRPSSPSRPLPPPGYVSESITTRGTTPSTVNLPSSNTRPGNRRQLTVVIHGVGPHNANKLASTTSVDSRQKSARQEIKRDKVSEGGPRRKALRAKVREKKPKDLYDWNKRGRLDELRIRYLARKFSRVWLRSVFGRIHPAQVRRHHTLTLTRKVFKVWYDEWWVSRREWKLTIRAECHDRYRLWQMVWVAWTTFTANSIEKKRHSELASQRAHRYLTGMAWKGWVEYVSMNRERRKTRREIEKWRASQLVGSTWQSWKKSLSDKKQRQLMETLALYHWAHTLTQQVWHTWLVQLHTRQVLNVQEAVACRHRSQTLLLSAWAGWRDYVQYRRHKTEMSGLAVTAYNSRLVVRVMEVWKVRFRRSREIAAFQELIVARGEQARRRRAFQNWRFYIALREYKTYQHNLAGLFYEVSLKSRAFVCLRGYMEQQQMEAKNMEMACQHRVRMLIRQSWVKWLHGCEHREEIKMGPQTRVAQKHFFKVTTKKVLVGWVRYTLHRRERRQLYSVAEDHFRSKALPKCFNALKENVEIQLYKCELKETASGFRRETVLSMVFYKWWRESQFSQDIRMLERVAILHDEEVKKKNLLKLWKTRTRERVRHLAQESAATSHHRHRMMAAAFDKWSSRQREILTRKRCLQKASNHYSTQLVGVLWCAWKRYINKRRRSTERRVFADRHYQKIVSHKLMLAWKTYHTQCRVELSRTLTAREHLNTCLERRVLCAWGEAVKISKKKRQLCSHAYGHYRTVALKKYLELWCGRTAVSIDERERENDTVLESRHTIMAAKLTRVFSKWRLFSIRCVDVRLATERANDHHDTALQRRYFNAWWEHHRLKVRKRLLTRQGVWFTKNRLTAMCYSQWRVQFMHALVTKQKSSMALWHWSQSLQRNCLHSWLLHTLERRRKTERYSEAMKRHRSRLVNIGVTQWIKVATQMQAQREEVALKQQTKSAHTVLKCVRRCASHWQALTRKRKLRPPPLRASLNVMKPVESHIEPSSQATNDWNHLLRNLQLPDGNNQHRPQPRRPSFPQAPLLHISHPPLPHSPHPYSEAHPRQPSTHQPILLHPPHRDNGSFTFLTSTCSEPSQNETTDVSRETYLIETSDVQSQDCTGSLSTLKPSQDCPVLCDKFNHSTNKRLTHHSSHSETTSTHSPTLGRELAIHVGHRQNETVCQSDCRSRELPLSLTDVSVQQEMVRMRDTLKYFHQLKAKQKLLEARLSSLTKQENGEQWEQVRLELDSVSHSISSKEPLIKQFALRVSQLVTQTGLVD